MLYQFLSRNGVVFGVFSDLGEGRQHQFCFSAPDNRDYQQFLKDWEAGAEVLNPDGSPAPYVSPEAK